MKAIVFIGPSISQGDCRNELEATYSAPASQGDIYRAVDGHVTVIGLVDGAFDSVPAVWHKEILWALSKGVRIYGSASMGALRAAELTSFGMIGVGKIFELYNSSEIEDDDEVAVAHFTSEREFRPVSEAMINIRLTLAAAEQEGVISSHTSSVLCKDAKCLHYPERSYPTLLEGADGRISVEDLTAFKLWLPNNRIDQKREDALLMLRSIRADLEHPRSGGSVAFAFQHTSFWSRAMRHADAAISPGPTTRTVSLADLVLDEVRLSPSHYFECYQAALLHHLMLEEARRSKVQISVKKTHLLIEEWLHTLGIESASELNAWLTSNHLTRSDVEHLGQERALLAQSRTRLRRYAEPQMLNQLRFSGDYEAVAQRAVDKEQMVTLQEMQNPSPHITDLTDDELLQRYLDRLPRPSASTFDAYSSLMQFVHEQRDQAVTMLRREQRYRTILTERELLQ